MEQNILPPPSPEARIEPIRTLDQLRHVRETEALHASDRAMRNKVGLLNPSDGLSTSLVKVSNAALSYDVGGVSYADLAAYDSLGVPPERIFGFLETTASSKESNAFDITVEDETLTTKGYGRGVSLTFKVDGVEPDYSNKRTPAKMTDKIADRFKHSPAHQAITELDQRLQQQEEIVGPVHTEFFDPDADKLGTLALLAQGGFLSYTVDAENVLSNESVASILGNQLVDYGVEVIEKPGSVTYRKNEHGTFSELIVDKATGEIALGYEQDIDYFYNERANQNSAESIPFVDTRCARELFTALDDAGIMLHPKYQAEMTRIGEAERNGSVYTQLSREIAKWVDRPQRQRVEELFVAYSPDTNAQTTRIHGLYNMGENLHEERVSAMTDAERAAEAAKISEKLLSIDTIDMSEPTRVLFTMVQDAINRKTAEEVGLPELPVTGSDVKIEGGACFDVASYYIGAAGDRRGLRSIEAEGGVKLLEKTHGAHTFMLEQPVLLNGVRLPKGSLMQKGNDGGWAVLRLTPFCFDTQEDILATGSEIAKTEVNESRNIRSIGGSVLSNVIDAVR